MTYYEQFLKEHVDDQMKSIAAYQDGKHKIWLKKAGRRHSTMIYIPLKWLASFLRLNALSPVPNYGGERTIRCEYERIQSLNQIGIATPEVLAVSKKGLLLKDISDEQHRFKQLDHALAEAALNLRLELYQASILAVAGIHQKASYLSEAFARNIMINEQYEIKFLDFETDPREYLSLKNCQVRDWLCFVFSTSYRFEEQQLDAASKLLYDTLKHTPKIYREICKTGHKLRWILRFKPEKLGNDGKRIQKCMLFLQYLERHDPLPMI